MPNHDDHLEQAARDWREGRPLDAGRLIFENLPDEVRPKWALRILQLVLERSGIRSPVLQQVLDTANDPNLWVNGHHVFSMVRDETLKLSELHETSGLLQEQTLRAYVLSLAELVAKVTYNATDPPDEFDEDSGWWIASFLRRFVDQWFKDDEFSKAAWSALSSEELSSDH